MRTVSLSLEVLLSAEPSVSNDTLAELCEEAALKGFTDHMPYLEAVEVYVNEVEELEED